MSYLRIPLIIIIGLAAGLGIGLYVGWELVPTEYVNASPAYLAEPYQQDYVRMVAAAYAVEGDLTAAQTRLDSLGENGRSLLTAVMLDAILHQQNDAEIRQLVNLAAAVGISSPAMEPYLNQPLENTP